MLAPLTNYERHAPEDLEITALCLDSRTAAPGALFAALRGQQTDGHRFLAQAVERGAACVLTEEAPALPVPYILVPDSRYALARMAAVWYGEPAKKMTVVGVTGTNGKTTTTYLLKQILEQTLHVRVGLIGTNQNMIGDEILPAQRTTPESLQLQELLFHMACADCTHVVMEVSSHALMQHRTAGIDFAVGIFTNLTQDHLDYHDTMESYCDAKARLFQQCSVAVVNGDDAWTPRILQHAVCRHVSFGEDLTNDLIGWRARYESRCVRFLACDDGQQVETCVPIPGRFSLYNALGALLAARELGVPLDKAARALETCHGVRGRCEVLPTDTDYTVLIDYAHTPDGLKNILSAVCGFAENRVIAVFGCGGDRDRTKRPRMGRIAAALADAVVVTSDNPRTESPYSILHDILEGMNESQTPFAVLENRREAIAYALDHAAHGDVVVLAGKGHEPYQIIGTTAYPLDEREVVRAHLSQQQRKDAAAAAKGMNDESSTLMRDQLCDRGDRRQAPDSGAAQTQGGAEHP